MKTIRISNSSVEEILSNKELRYKVYNTVLMYDERMANIYNMYYMKGYNKANIARDYNFTRVRVGQIIKKLETSIIKKILEDIKLDIN